MESVSQWPSGIHSSPHRVISSDFGYLTPPRPPTVSREQSSTNPSFSQLFHQPKLLTSAELKRRFSPIPLSTKKRRYHLIRTNDCLVPTERNLNTPVILPTLFERNAERSPTWTYPDDRLVPLFSSDSSIASSKPVHPRPDFDYLMPHCLKTEQENLFSISETIMKQKLKALLQKK